MQSSTSIKELIQKLMPKPNEIIIGRVTSENPFAVQAENDEKLILSRKSLVVPARIEPLHTGDCIHILVLNGGKKYYALDRAVM